MSDTVSAAQDNSPSTPPTARTVSYLHHAKVIGFLTLISRLLGLVREAVSSRYFGSVGWTPFRIAFLVPNLFRKLLGEGALSAAFIPLYAQSVRNDSAEQSRAFANASVNLLMVILIGLTIVGELILAGIVMWWPLSPGERLMMQLTIIMLPYVMLVCGTAFLGSILQVHKRFTAVTMAPIILNLVQIVAIVAAALTLDLRVPEGEEVSPGQTRGLIWLSVSVLLAGVLQIIVLIPSLRAVGFRFQPILHFWTPPVRRMLKLSLPVALGAGVLQISVLIDGALSAFLVRTDGNPTFTLLGWTFDYPLVQGAPARIGWAQYLSQFPLGIFAIALATAIFPQLSDSTQEDQRPKFRSVLRQGIEAALFIGLPASIGLILVSHPAVGLLYEGGEFTPADTNLTALSTAFYAAGIWAFSLQQIMSRAYFALHDMWTPVVLSVLTLTVNLLVELPLMWTPLGEAGMAAGTTISFSLQAIVMLWLLNRRLHGLELRNSLVPVGKMLIATAVMAVSCLLIKQIPGYPHGSTKLLRLMQVILLMGVGGLTYFGAAALMGMNVTRHLRRRK